jgi:plasmid maintenance system killer protein
VRIAFHTRRLCQAYEESNRAIRLWGPDVAGKYIQRVEAMYAARNFEDIKCFRAFEAHPLKGQRVGQWALALTRRWRLIVIPSENGETVTIKEVTKHYGG